MSEETIAASSQDPAKAKDEKIRDWITRNVGGTIERFEQQPRWRGGWWVDVRRDGDLLNLYVREERKEDYPPWPLEHEAGALMVLEKHGVPVPHIYGICDDPHATVMDCLPGEFDFSKVSEEERVAILEDYATALARQHAIPPEELVGNGFKMPQTPEEISLGCFKTCEAMYLAGKKFPDPCVEFLRQWVYRNIPQHRNKVSILSVDSGQFFFKDGKVTGLYDFEYACLGDPMIDIAYVPLRLAMYNGGDSSPFFRRYAELTGETFELEVLAFHAVWWSLCTPFILARDFDAPSAQTYYFEMLGWYTGIMLTVFGVLADAKGLHLPSESAMPESSPSRWAPLIDVMAARIPEPEEGEPYAITEQRKSLAVIKRMDANRDVEREYIDDVAKLTGIPVSDWREADRELEKFVLAAGPERDDELIALFHRWAVGQARTLLFGLAEFPNFGPSWPKLSQLVRSSRT